jgi:hypothetical protein
MELNIAELSSSIVQKQSINEIIKCNDFTAQYGIVLTYEQAVELVEARFESLSANGRIELGGGVIDKIIREFCDSPYVTRYNYAETIQELLKLFYFYKNETLDLLSDDELIKFMKESFNNSCSGSIELLGERELDKMANNLRYGYSPFYSEDTCGSNEEDENEQY